MTITEVRIRNFRGIRRLNVELAPVTVLIGENNSGKTSVLDALKLCLRELGPRRQAVFNGLDFHLADGDSEPSSADPIEIEIRFSERSAGEWDDDLVASLNRVGVYQVDDEERGHVRLRVTCRYDRDAREFASDWSFLDFTGDPLSRASRRALAVLQAKMRFVYLMALRDAARHFDAKGPFWRPFLRDSQLSPERKAEIETKLREVNDLVVSSHASFEQVQKRLRRVQSVVPLSTGEAVSIEAVPGRMFDMLAKAQVQLGTSTGAKIPLSRHGEGTQSLAVLMLFSAFLETQAEGVPVLALEEPEAHLHPSAIRALWELVRGFSGQKLISTHSGELVAGTDIGDILRLARTPDGIRAFRVPRGFLSQEETRKFNYYIRRARGELLFARCWLLVEGETETWVYPSAARALGLSLHREGVRIVEFSQTDVGLLAKIADALGISWTCVGDDDGNRAKVERALAPHLDGADESGVLVFPYVNIEVNLIEAFADIYGKYMPTQNLRKLTKERGDPGYWQEYAAKLPKRAKTRAASEVAIAIEARGPSSVTVEIREVLEKALALAQGGG